MSTVKSVCGLLLAATIAVGGGVAGGFTRLPPAVVSGAVMLLVLLACYPAVRRWGAGSRNLTFKLWATGSAVASITASAVMAAVNRL